MGAEWRGLSDDQKAKWVKKAQESKAEYQLKVDAALNREGLHNVVHKSAIHQPTKKPKISSDESSLSSLSPVQEKKKPVVVQSQKKTRADDSDSSELSDL